MDSQSSDIGGRSSSWSSAANWTIAGGSLENTVAFESFYSPINDEDTVASSSPKSPLVLRPPSVEFCPCEITLRFMEKHEIRQVYVRSTARVYEIYYATNSQNENEYLCTVRCGAARRDEDLLHTSAVDDVSPNMKEPDRNVAEGSVKSGSTNEDDWVEVKVPAAPAFDSKDISSLSMSSADTWRLRQNFYEATAEVTDADPCTSLTIRLLSLQNKNSVCVDEVYVFANPVDLEEDHPVENSAQSSLMSMLVPTLLQFSKTTATGKKDDGHTSNAERTAQNGAKAFESINNLTEVQQVGKSGAADCDEEKLQETNESDRAVALEAPVQVPFKDSKHDEPLHRIESLLDKLVSRMDRMENSFLRFEENMLKPINSIEERLKNVEQKLEILTKEPPGSELHSCYRMSAPTFSGNDSVSNSFYDGGNDRPSCEPIEPDRKELPSGASPVALEDKSDSISPLLRPSLVVTAPEFSNDDDEEENQSLEIPVDSLTSKPKRSIDDVLASALARFASSCSSINTPECTETVAIRPPDFLDEDDGEDYQGALSGVPSEIDINHINCSQKIDETQDTTSSASVYPCSANYGNLSSSSDDHSFKIAGEDDEQVFKDLEGIEGAGNEEVIEGTSEDWISNGQIHPHQSTENAPDTTEADAAEVTREGCSVDILHDVLGFSRDVSIVDFEIPILDVNFAPISNSENTLKDFLGGGMPELDDGAPYANLCDLISVEEDARVGPAPTNEHLSVDMNYYSIMDEPLVADGENLQDHCPCSNHSTIISSLI